MPVCLSWDILYSGGMVEQVNISAERKIVNRIDAQKIKNREGLWVTVMFLIPIAFILYYLVFAPILGGNSGFNEGLIIGLSVTQGVIGGALTLVSGILMSGIKKWFTLLGLLGSAAFFFYAYFLATFSVSF